LQDTRMNIDAHVGLYKDLELHFGIPIIFQQDRRWNYAAGTSDANTTIYRNCGTAAPSMAGTMMGCDDPSMQGRGTNHLFEVGDPFTISYRGGVGNLTFGLAYAFFS